MNSVLVLAADGLVAILLAATIATSVRLSRRFVGLKADEAAMRAVVAELSGATANAERAIVGLRATVDACDATLRDRLSAAETCRDALVLSVAGAESAIAALGGAVAGRPLSMPLQAAIAPVAPAARDPLKVALHSARDIADRAARRLESRAA